MDTSHPAAFCQPFCSVTRVTAANGMTEFQRTGFLVRVRDRILSVVEVPAIAVLNVPATAVRIATPRSQRRLSDGSLLRIDDDLWSVQFGSVYQVEAARSGRRGLRRAVFGSGCGYGGFAGPGGSSGLGRTGGLGGLGGLSGLGGFGGFGGSGDSRASGGSDASHASDRTHVAGGSGAPGSSGAPGGLRAGGGLRGSADSRHSYGSAGSCGGSGGSADVPSWDGPARLNVAPVSGMTADYDFCFGFGLATRRAARRGRELNAQFTAALLRAGAIDEDPPQQ